MNAPTALDLAQLKRDAEQRAGLSDYGDGFFWPHLEVLLSGLNSEANLNSTGTALQYERLVEILVNHLRLQYFLTKYPEIGEEVLAPPIIILGLPRAGTTMLQRLLSAQDELLATYWYEMRFPVPDPDWDFTDANDQRIVKAKQEVAALIEANPDLLSIHPLDAMAADEDILLLENGFLSEMPPSQANLPTYHHHYMESDALDVYRFHRRVMQFLQWQRRRKGETVEGKRWVLKAPAHMHHIPAARATYPDAQFIVSRRDPVQVIPSIASFYYAVWQIYSDSADKHTCGRHTAETFLYGLALTQQQQKLHPDQFTDVDFEDLMRDPVAVVKHLYRYLNLPFSPATAANVERWREENKREKRAAHQYSAAEFGLTESGIIAQAEEIMRATLAETQR